MASAVAVRSVTSSAVRTWAADVVTGGATPYMLLSVEEDGDSATSEYVLIVSDSWRSTASTLYDCTVYKLIYHNPPYVSAWYETSLQTVDSYNVDTSVYVCYSSFNGFPHLREEVFSDASFADFSFMLCGVLGCLLLLDACRIVRARLGGGS